MLQDENWNAVSILLEKRAKGAKYSMWALRAGMIFAIAIFSIWSRYLFAAEQVPASAGPLAWGVISSVALASSLTILILYRWSTRAKADYAELSDRLVAWKVSAVTPKSIQELRRDPAAAALLERLVLHAVKDPKTFSGLT